MFQKMSEDFTVYRRTKFIKSKYCIGFNQRPNLLPRHVPRGTVIKLIDYQDSWSVIKDSDL